jgi:hypothetical protein
MRSTSLAEKVQWSLGAEDGGANSARSVERRLSSTPRLLGLSGDSSAAAAAAKRSICIAAGGLRGLGARRVGEAGGAGNRGKLAAP